jgi:hypothetical protein
LGLCAGCLKGLFPRRGDILVQKPWVCYVCKRLVQFQFEGGVCYVPQR